MSATDYSPCKIWMKLWRALPAAYSCADRCARLLYILIVPAARHELRVMPAADRRRVSHPRADLVQTHPVLGEQAAKRMPEGIPAEPLLGHIPRPLMERLKKVPGVGLPTFPVSQAHQSASRRQSDLERFRAGLLGSLLARGCDVNDAEADFRA